MFVDVWLIFFITTKIQKQAMFEQLMLFSFLMLYSLAAEYIVIEYVDKILRAYFLPNSLVLVRGL